MADQKRKPGRPPKHIGLSTPLNLKKVVDGNSLRNMRASESEQEGSVLSDTRKEDAPPSRLDRVFGTARSDDGQRTPTPIEAEVLDTPGRIEQAAELKLTDVLKSIGMEQVDPVVAREYGKPVTNLEALAHRIWNEALGTAMGSQRAREMIVERLEGKAVRGEKPAVPDTTLNEQLDRTETDLINSLKEP